MTTVLATVILGDSPHLRFILQINRNVEGEKKSLRVIHARRDLKDYPRSLPHFISGKSRLSDGE